MSLPASFWAKVDKDGPVPTRRPDLGPCWVWTGAKQSRGYGSFGIGQKRSALAHRLSYADTNGDGHGRLPIDHLCNNKACVRPSHLEAVTTRENNYRSYEYNQRFCPDGHSMTFRWTHHHTVQERYCPRCEIAAARRAA